MAAGAGQSLRARWVPGGALQPPQGRCGSHRWPYACRRLPPAATTLPPPPPAVAAADGSSLADIEIELRLEGGRQLLGFPAARDGSFSFPEVPVGVHTLTVNARGLVFPTLKLDVGAARKGRVEAVAADLAGVSAGRRQQPGAVCVCAWFLLQGDWLSCWSAVPTQPEAAAPTAWPLPTRLALLQTPAMPHPLLLRPYARMEYFEVGADCHWSSACLLAPACLPAGPAGWPQSRRPFDLSKCHLMPPSQPPRLHCLTAPPPCRPAPLPPCPPAEARGLQPAGLPEDPLRHDGRLHALLNVHPAKAQGGWDSVWLCSGRPLSAAQRLRLPSRRPAGRGERRRGPQLCPTRQHVPPINSLPNAFFACLSACLPACLSALFWFQLQVDPEEYKEMIEERNKVGAAITGRSPEKRRD